MVPHGVSGPLEEIYFWWVYCGRAGGQGYGLVEQDDLVESDYDVQKWPVRSGRPYKEKLTPTEPA